MSKSLDSILPKPQDLGLSAPDFTGYWRNRNSCPSEPGSYLVWLYLKSAPTLTRPIKTRLPAGWYLYAGSANGSGGLRAPLSRHLAKDKRRRWHIDQLTIKATRRYGWAWIEARECDLITQLQAQPNFHHALTGFGSSDCSQCQSHLLRWSSPNSDK